MDINDFKASQMRKMADLHNGLEIDMEEKTKQHLNKIFESIKFNAKNGKYSTVCELEKMQKYQDEIYSNILNNLMECGYKAEMRLYDFFPCNFIEISW
ncbi:hypothetical protein OXPF_12930 [Oxobacter pfennigii]|uniref:Uncharacterized protein n=1 Tax=Oxobacter pfennigii TaxID=36849 RepID=A0A0P8YZ87_9CLOT|nr:hypothetical protein [Oxobacter pfennigii]KPU45166.1 hypothetical protein OXPF_12930 [Oxobacter pfennigii]